MFTDVEIEILDNIVYIANDGSSGCKYKFNSKEELKEYINNYMSDLVDYLLEDK
jgi:hypothetical protein